jgi:hypothetical protein
MILLYVMIGVVIVAALVAITKMVSTDRYANMTEEEFEAEARRSSMMGAAMSATQKVFDPSHRVEYVEEQRDRAEAESSHSGDRPPEGNPNK